MGVRTCMEIYAQHYCRYSLGPLQEQLTRSCRLSQAPRQFKKQHITRSSVTIVYTIYTTVAREHHHLHNAPVRTVSQNSSPPRHVASSSCRSVLLPCTRLPGPVGSLATMRRFLGGTCEESVEAFSLFFLDFFLHRRHSCSRPAVSRPMAW